MNDGTEKGPAEGEAMRRLAEAGREALREVWSRRDERDRLPEPMRRLLEILEQHREFRPFWEGADPDEHSNPFLHVTYHRVVLDQVAAGDPPETAAAIDRLVAGGVTRHEAEHRVMQVLVREMVGMVARRGPFDRARYVEALNALTP